MYYAIYKITNQINGKFYIGSHKTKDLNDTYMGSGKYLKRAQDKYGIENFTKEILFVFDNATDMYKKEAEIVNEDFLAEENTYNLKKGGSGGFDYINLSGLNTSWKSPDERSNKISITHKHRIQSGGYLSENFRKKAGVRSDNFVSAASKGTFKGKTHSDETKKKISEKNSVSQLGEGNSQFGTMWITDDSKNMKIPKDAAIPNGWRKGRVIK